MMTVMCGLPVLTICTVFGKSQPLLHRYLVHAHNSPNTRTHTHTHSESDSSEAAMQSSDRHRTRHIINSANEGVPLTGRSIARQEIRKQVNLRRHIDQLKEKKLQAEEEVLKHE